jgi:release factor glutamine methyltransferase
MPAVPCRALDLGTGSGAIALSIAHARPNAEVWACDVSPEALEVAKENARRLGLNNVHFRQSNWFSALPALQFDVIVSNPPYIAEGDPHLSQGDLRFEPARALSSGIDGLRDIRHLVTESKRFLTKGGWLLFEHGYDQAERVRGLLQAAGYDKVFSARDLAGIERVSCGRAA